MAQFETGVKDASYATRDAVEVSDIASPIVAITNTFQFSVTTAAGTRDFEVSVSLTETTGNTTPAPAPVDIIEAA
jgi:hypothetical protein